jgi:hypothetical protein
MGSMRGSDVADALGGESMADVDETGYSVPSCYLYVGSRRIDGYYYNPKATAGPRQYKRLANPRLL